MMTRTSRPASRLFQRTAIAAALALSFVTTAHALTLSRPSVQSKQGEALRAEIDITEISISEQENLEASLASADVYRAAKVELPTSNGVPLDVDLQLKRRPNGRLFLAISSTQSVRSNAVDLLLDLKWATGRLLRDISLSIDDTKSKKQTSTPDALAQEITIKRGDTASELLAPITPEGVSLEQMLLALLKQNPDAFVDSNVNRMKAGALVKLPTADQAREISKEDARQEIRVQAKDFEAYKINLAARASNGKIADASRDSAGKLDAKIENKRLKTDDDKLTLTQPSKGATEDQIAKQREAQEAASRAAEINRNIAELGKIAAATAASESASSTSPSFNFSIPANALETGRAWLDELAENPNTPVGAGALIAAMLLIALWRRRSASTDSNSKQDIEGLPPLNVKFDLDLPAQEEPTLEQNGHTEEVMTHAQELHEHPHDHASTTDDADHDASESSSAPSQEVRPTLEMPNISLDLEEPPVNDHPFQVRMDLADELWKLGQLHTSRALMEEVANEATGAVKEKALQWLAERG